MGIEVNKKIEELMKQGKTSEEIALAVSQMYEAEVCRIRAAEEAKRRELMLEERRKNIRKVIFDGMNLAKSQQIAYLYQYAERYPEEIKNGILEMMKVKES